jgi:hypothetical protein
MRIYVAHPFTAPSAKERYSNVYRSLEVATDLLEKGYQPFVPLLSAFWDQYANGVQRPVSYERWLEWDLHWLLQCDALLVLGISPGVEREIECALENKIPVYYSIAELPPPR